MNGTINHYQVDDTRLFSEKMLSWSSQFNIFCFATSCGYESPYSRYDFLFAAEPTAIYQESNSWSPQSLQAFSNQHPDWLFGHLNYPGQDPDPVGFPACFFFNPGICITLNDHQLTIRSKQRPPDEIWQSINNSHALSDHIGTLITEIQPLQARSDYLQSVEQVKRHIARGDCYELNYCQGFRTRSTDFNPFSFFKRLIEEHPNPFAVLYRIESSFCICASPERFLQRVGNTVISQPIKGTIRRSLSAPDTDKELREQLSNSEKDRAENVMVVDLVRNDLSRVCARNSVEVSELFGVYSFPNLHHLISTVQGTVLEETPWTSILAACFPMGSMTGAPKQKVMEITANLEKSARGLFSGTIGYVDPAGQFDFNVVIRSVFYNQETGQLHFKAGGGITAASDPVKEYEESLLKAAAIHQLLSGK